MNNLQYFLLALRSYANSKNHQDCRTYTFQVSNDKGLLPLLNELESCDIVRIGQMKLKSYQAIKSGKTLQINVRVKREVSQETVETLKKKGYNLS